MVRFESVPNRESGGAATANLGHRLGGSGPQTDNTIQSLRSAIERVDDSGFKYWEFDVHESADGVLFAFHDDEIESNGQKVRNFHSNPSRSRRGTERTPRTYQD